jgi:hypothetical protein
MVFDASTVFVLALVVGIVALLGWAEIQSRRQQASGGPGDPPVGAPPPGSPKLRRR